MEVLLVIIIIGVLASIVIARVVYSKVEAQRQACRANTATMNSQIEFYQAQLGIWPSALTNLTDQDYIDAIPTCPFGTSYVYNTTQYRVEAHSH
jgi:competence protein ComGC